MIRKTLIGALVLSLCTASPGASQISRPGPQQPGAIATANAAQSAMWRREWDKAIELASRALASADLRTEEGLRAHQIRAAAYLRKGEYERTISDTSAIISQDPFNVAPDDAECRRNAIAHRNRGIAYGGLHEYGKAMRELTCALATPVPWFAFCWHFDRGQMYEREGQNGLAAGDYAEGGRLEPKRARQLYCVGVTRRELGDVSGLIYILQAQTLEPDIAREMQGLGNYGF